MLVSGAASGQDKLSQAAQSSAKTITQLTDVVKLGAASIGSDDPETQVKNKKKLSRPACLSSPACYLFAAEGMSVDGLSPFSPGARDKSAAISALLSPRWF